MILSWKFHKDKNFLILNYFYDMTDSFGTPWSTVPQAPLSMGLPRQEYWSGLPFLLQGIFLTWGTNPHLLNPQVDALQLSHLGSQVLISHKFPGDPEASNPENRLRTTTLKEQFHSCYLLLTIMNFSWLNHEWDYVNKAYFNYCIL